MYYFLPGIRICCVYPTVVVPVFRDFLGEISARFYFVSSAMPNTIDAK